MNNQKGFASIILVVVIVAIVAVGGYFVFFKKSGLVTQQPPSTTSNNSKTANWKKYRNEKHGFEFKYPSDLNIDNKFSTPDSLVFIPANSLSISFFIADPITDPNGKMVTLNEYLSIYGYDANYDSVEHKINELNWIKFVSKQRILDQNQNNGSIRYILQKNNVKYEFVYNGNVNSPNMKLFEQIVQTFAFEQPQTNNSQNTQPTQPPATTPSSLPTSCVDKPETKAVITSLSSYSGSVGTKLEIRGCNFAGFEGDKNAWIENSQGVKGILYGEQGSTAKVIKVTLKSPLCSQDNSYSGLSCSSYLTLTAGTYKIWTMPWGANTKSNLATFTIQ